MSCPPGAPRAPAPCFFSLFSHTARLTGCSYSEGAASALHYVWCHGEILACCLCTEYTDRIHKAKNITERMCYSELYLIKPLYEVCCSILASEILGDSVVSMFFGNGLSESNDEKKKQQQQQKNNNSRLHVEFYKVLHIIRSFIIFM